MRLLDAHTLAFHEYFDESAIPPYAILSHVWEPGQEVSYREMLDRSESTLKKRGYDKIEQCARLAEGRSRPVLGRHALHRQVEQRRALRGHQFHVSVV